MPPATLGTTLIIPESRKIRRFIVIGTARYLVVQALLALHSMTETRCLVICEVGTRYLKRSTLVSEYMEIRFDGSDDEALAARIRRFHDDWPGACVVPADCDGARAVDRIRDRIRDVDVPSCPDAGMLDCFDNKWHFHRFCEEHGLNTPPTLFFRDKHDLNYASLAQELGSRFIIKPVSEASSRGAHVISCAEDLRREVLCKSSYRYAPLIAQRFIKGSDIGVNLLSIRGEIKALSIQRRVVPTRDGSKIVFFANPYLEKAAGIIARKSGYHGVMNVDARLEDETGKVWLFESNPRLWRSFSASVWNGLNFLEVALSPSPRKEPRRLVYGRADTYFHPLFRPALWPYMLARRGHRGRLVRAMGSDISTLADSSRILLTEKLKSMGQLPKAMLSRLKNIAPPFLIEESGG